MDEESNANPFQDIINSEIEKIQATQPTSKKKVTTPVSILSNTASTYPRATITAGIAGSTAVAAVKDWKSLYKEGLDVLRARRAEEAKAVADIAEKGIVAFPRMEGTNAEIRGLARKYATERIFQRFPFNNAEAANRVADLKTGRIILTGEKVPVIGNVQTRVPESLQWVEPTVRVTPAQSGTAVAVTPRQIKVADVAGVPRPNLTTRTATGYGTDYEKAFNFSSEPTRIASTKPYVPRSSPNPNIASRIAQTSTGGWLGKANVGLEAAGALYDITREDGPVSQAYKSAGKGYEGYGIALGGLAGLSRLGRGATNAISFGTGEYLGIYDTLDLLAVEDEAKQRYMSLRGTAGHPAESYPVIKKGQQYVPMEGDNPQLKRLEFQIASEKGIDSSAITEKGYMGSQYNYVLQGGKIIPIMKPEYAANFEAETNRRNALMAKYQNILNVDPAQGNIGWQYAQDPSKQYLLNAGSGSSWDTGGYLAR